ncbi:MAG: cyclophilin-like fold protein [Bacteroidales bacterium]
MKVIFYLLAFFALISCNKIEDDLVIDPPISNEDNNRSEMRVIVGATEFVASLADNSSAQAFKSLLPITITMSDYGSNEKVATITSLPTNLYNPSRIEVGDIMLWGSSSLVLFYDNFPTSYSYSRIGKIDDVEGLRELLNNRESVTVRFEII